VVHVHNTFPLLSPAIFHSVGDSAASVLTLHNYRLFCPGALMLRNGCVCTECLDSGSVIPALRHGCYRGSRIATLPLALSISLHRRIGTWTRCVDAFIALTNFQQDRLAAAGLPRDGVFVNPNFFPGNPDPPPWEERSGHVVFVGRLTPEKGAATLVEAWLLWGERAPELRIVGDGPLREELEERARSGMNATIRFLGQVSGHEAQREIASARLLVLPSTCFEGFPMVIREAFAFGTPVAVSNIGPLPQIVEHGTNGVVFSIHDPRALMETVRSAWETPGLLARLSHGARAAFESSYTEDAHYGKLMAIYEAALARKRLSVS
jgi:glycosyltransferase involved in cell wall biosynthesis